MFVKVDPMILSWVYVVSCVIANDNLHFSTHVADISGTTKYKLCLIVIQL